MTHEQDVSDYIYQPLETETSIRIIALKGSPRLEDDLQCEILHIDRQQTLRGQTVTSNI